VSTEVRVWSQHLKLNIAGVFITYLQMREYDDGNDSNVHSLQLSPCCCQSMYTYYQSSVIYYGLFEFNSCGVQ